MSNEVEQALKPSVRCGLIRYRFVAIEVEQNISAELKQIEEQAGLNVIQRQWLRHGAQAAETQL